MKKIIVAFDGNHFSEGAFEFVRHLNDMQPVLATGIFLPGIDYAELLYSIGGLSGPVYYKEIELNDTGILKENMTRFALLCEKNGIEYRIHPDDEKHVIDEVKLESRFADMLVLSSELFYENLGTAEQDDYIQTVLHKAECPVIVVPEHYKAPENVILCYDGSESSVYAIKQFAYLFPELTGMKTLLLFAGDENEAIPDLDYIEELAPRHFKDLRIFKLETDPGKYFNTWLEDYGSSLLVTGSYGRSSLSSLLRKSFITATIHEHKLPVFIAHR